ncbi:MAG: 4-oxalocrotonate tautomerase [Thermoplasmata archaeon]|nr:4-oxalocrotonate tautomerase [Thermoplasmata archaeon]NIS13102.1 4-oxalocrotonate tautomerase [Thermoplasmata archaeon]NIS21001.1 4-oxalocrotonate tautomerase [Thermoplasmata archaeon]NIT78459.1 4-oxalocrotonate tautomerase [Thermoplasmata archaeon]NIU50056.1 4-oxalocrotonate tautomerase [Thermoplasmata archaeon]
MPIAQVYMWPGRTAEEKKQLIDGITRVFVDMGIPADAVSVLVLEVPKDSWGGGGVPASDW